MGVDDSEGLFELVQAVLERARVAGHAAEHLTSDMIGKRCHIPLDIVDPGVYLGFLARCGTLRELGAVACQVARNRQLIAYKCAILRIFEHGVAPGHRFLLVATSLGLGGGGADDLEVFSAHELGDEGDEGARIHGIRAVVEFLAGVERARDGRRLERKNLRKKFDFDGRNTQSASD